MVMNTHFNPAFCAMKPPATGPTTGPNDEDTGQRKIDIVDNRTDR